MARYNKLFAAIATGFIALAARHGLDLSGTESDIADLLSVAFTAFAVYVIPNKKESSLT